MRGHDDHASGRDPERIQLDTGAAGSGPPDSGPSTGAVPGDRGVSRWRLRNWRLRSKLAVVLLVPALSTLTLAGLRLNTQLDDVELFGQVQRELQLSAQVAAVSDALQLERDAAVAFVAAGRVENSPEFTARSSKVDTEVGRLRDVAASTTGVNDGGARGVPEVVAVAGRPQRAAEHGEHHQVPGHLGAQRLRPGAGRARRRCTARPRAA